EIVVINDPSLVRTDASGNQRGVRGLWRDGQFVLNRAFIGSESEAQSVLEHEYAHTLLETQEGVSAIQQAIAAELGAAARAQIRKAYARHEGESDAAYESRITEEWFASLAEQQPNLWQRIVARVRQWLSRFGLVNLSDEEIGREILRALRTSRLTPEQAAGERESLSTYTFKTYAEKTETIQRAQETGAPQEGIAEAERVAEVQAGLVPE